MPYIKQEERGRYYEGLTILVNTLLDLERELPDSQAGHLNYVISSICKRLLERDLCYETANRIIGVLESVKQELYRRYIVPYEDGKIKQNGDI